MVTSTTAKKPHSYMDNEGNLQSAPRGKNDFGEGFRMWAAASNDGGENSFLSRGVIMEYLEKKKDGKISGDMHGGGDKNSKGKPRKLRSMDGSNGRRGGGGRAQSHQSHHCEIDDEGLEVHEEQPKPKRSYRTQRKDPTVHKFGKKQYRIGMQPHQNSDGIMMTRSSTK
ncbi:expressed unknown protein [Seminavis robusta]|uniref:Uncharacterized protein n=1 Tax=Seminavis robusta TaxID=568900 RepID=A0A9N8ETP3_9STRA|nr:expressed unknown protein [Seminavis robusta]|eukprot:Sro1665_g289560.1 n/a (169) ;mRNA; f:5041-5547